MIYWVVYDGYKKHTHIYFFCFRVGGKMMYWVVYGGDKSSIVNRFHLRFPKDVFDCRLKVR